MLNHIVLMGRLTRDPELRRTGSGVAVASFSLAVDRDFGGRDGGEKETDFIDIVAWRGTAEFVSKYFSKGRMAVVSGRLQIRNWTDKEGGKRRSAEVVADNVYFGDSKRDNDNGFAQSYGGGQNYGGSQTFAGGQQGYGAPQYGGAPGYGGQPNYGGGYGDPGFGGQQSFGGEPQYGGQPNYGAPAAQPAPAAAPGDFAIMEDDDSELPF